MMERDMEDLIASYPDDFFPERGFLLKGRQQSFAGVGRFDLLFEDRFRTKILMELKAVPAKYDVASQLAKYKDELQARGENHILMWLVAPQVPHSVREFLDRIGIEYSEIHLPQFRLVAERHGVVIRGEAPSEATGVFKLRQDAATRAVDLKGSNVQRSPQVNTGATVSSPSALRWRAHGYDLRLANPEDFESSLFSQFVERCGHSVPSGRNASLVGELKRWAADPGYSDWTHKNNASLLRWVTTSSYKSAVPHALAIWKYLFGEPAPTWYIWSQRKRSYEFDPRAWKIWFESLGRGS